MTENHEKTHIKTKSNTDSTGFSFNNSIDKSTIEDLIKCDICNIIFDTNTHEPLMIKCGHTFCKRCISLKTNNPEKNINKHCPLCKKKNVMCLDSAIANLKLVSIIKKLLNLNLLNNKKQMVYSKPNKTSKSPIKSNNGINNYYVNNVHNNANVNNNIKNNDINNVNIINKGKEPNTQINTTKPKTNVNINLNINKKAQSTKINNTTLINSIKNKISNLSNTANNANNGNNTNTNTNNLNNAININNVNNANNTNNANNQNNINNPININNENDIQLNNDTNKLNHLNKIPSNGQMKTISSGINELNDMNTPQIGNEVNIEDENFNKGMNNETIDVIPFYEEKINDTSFGDEINKILLKNLAQKKIFINEETMNEEVNISLKELNLMRNQDSLNISFANSKEENNNLNFLKLNKANLSDKNTHQIRTIYDKIKSLNKVEEQNERNNNGNIINNISNSIIIINDDNINIITDNSSSQSQEKNIINNAILGDKLNLKVNNELDPKDKENNENDLLKINQLNINKNNNLQNVQNIKINPIINKNVNINLNKDLKLNENNINIPTERFSQNVKISKIGIHKHVHSNSDDYNEEKNKQYLQNYANIENKHKTINAKTSDQKKIKETKKLKINENQNLNNSYESGSNSNSLKKKIYSPGNNLSKSFVNLSGNNLEELEDNINEQKNIEIQNMKKNLDNNKFMTINIIKTSKSQIEKIKNNIYYESQNIKTKTNKEIKDNNYQIPINSTSNKKININNNIYNNNVITEIKGTTKDNNNNIIITLNSNTYNNIDTEKDKIPNIINTNQNINITKNVINNNNNNTNTNISKNTKDQIIRKNSKTNETYKKLKAEFDLLMNERYSVLLNKNISTLNTSNTIYNSSNTSSTLTISNSNLNILSKQRKKQEEAFQNYFKNPKYKIDQDKTKIKFLQNNDFFIGILDQEEKFPQKGIYLTSNGEYYDGEFVNGKKEGEGKLIYVNGNQYQGSFLGGLPDGKGKLTQTNNDIYEGDWKNGKIMGQGERVYNNGDKYVGSLLNDIRNGKGLYLFINGDSYNGNWVNGKANGKGILRFRNGDIYDGEFKENSICGRGTFKKNTGETLIGEFKSGLINGMGTSINTLGEKYNGEFLFGKKHGNGKLYNKDGKLIQAGIWKNDKYCGNIKFSK